MYIPQTLNTEELSLLSITTGHMKRHNIHIYTRLAYNNIIACVHTTQHVGITQNTCILSISRNTKSVFPNIYNCMW